jgi:hypothetical protein
MRVSFEDKTQTPSSRRSGTLVQCIQVMDVPKPRPIGERVEQEVVPNIWGVVADDKTGALVAMPIYLITAKILPGQQEK